MVSRRRRLVDLQAGTGMVVTDLHGDWDAYRRYRDRFLALQAQGKADYLILTGDLVHFTGPPELDQSLEIVLDVIDLGRELGERLVYLLGNHELPHIYSYILAKGDYLFTPRFQWAMGAHRGAIIDLFENLPFFLRTKAGVVICHAGVSDVVRQPGGLAQLFDLWHQDILADTGARYSLELRPALRQTLGQQHGRSYGELVRDCFAVNSADDPRYDDFLIGSFALGTSRSLQLLYELVTTRNELQHGRQLHETLLQETLASLSAGFERQRVLVSGHMDCDGGHTLVSPYHLRLASAKNAHPRAAGQYLLFDMAQKIGSAEALLPRLGSVFVSRSSE
jgi:hypothetical protein